VSGRIFRWFAIAASALIGACSSSPPTRFYTLSETAPETHPASQPGVGTVFIYRVTIPGEIDRPQLVRQMDANRLQIAEEDRWGAPLDEMIRRVLSGDLARRLPLSPVANAGRQHLLSVDIREFYGDANCNVTLRAAWTPKRAGTTAPATAGATAHPEPAQATAADIHVSVIGACPDSLPATMSVALGQLSDRIIAGVIRSTDASSK
jgi:uncharacterized lipoprotein YmbA